MRNRGYGACLLLAALLSGCCGASKEFTERDRNSARNVRMIDIYYQHTGWGFQSDHFRLEIGEGDAMSRTWFDVPDVPDHERMIAPADSIDFDAVVAFVHYLNQPNIAKDAGISALSRTISMRDADKGGAGFIGYPSACNAALEREYLRRLRDRREIRKALESSYEREITWTDDYPSMEIRVSFDDGSEVSLQSRAQSALMLPWRKDGVETWDYRLADAIANLLPDEHARFQGHHSPRTRFLRSRLVNRMAQIVQSEVLRGELARAPICKRI